MRQASISLPNMVELDFSDNHVGKAASIFPQLLMSHGCSLRRLGLSKAGLSDRYVWLSAQTDGVLRSGRQKATVCCGSTL